MYLDTACIVKFYLNEPDSDAVREAIRGEANAQGALHASAWSLAEVQAVFHRRMCEGWLDAAQSRALAEAFLEHVDSGFWNMVPVTEGLLRRTGALLASAPPEVSLRAADAVHIVTARELGETAIWTNDRRLLDAAGHFGLKGRSV